MEVVTNSDATSFESVARARRYPTDEEGVDVTAQDHRIHGARPLQRIQQSLARGGVARPRIGCVLRRFCRALVDLRERRALRQQCPGRGVLPQTLVEPALLLRTQHGARRIEPFGAFVAHALAAELRRPRAGFG